MPSMPWAAGRRRLGRRPARVLCRAPCGLGRRLCAAGARIHAVGRGPIPDPLACSGPARCFIASTFSPVWGSEPRGIDVGLVAADGGLGRRWKLWLAVALGSLFLWMGVTALTMNGPAPIVARHRRRSCVSFWPAPAGCFFLIAASSALRLRSVRALLDSLSTNAYSLYLVHYGFGRLAAIRPARVCAFRPGQRLHRLRSHRDPELDHDTGVSAHSVRRAAHRRGASERRAAAPIAGRHLRSASVVSTGRSLAARSRAAARNSGKSRDRRPPRYARARRAGRARPAPESRRGLRRFDHAEARPTSRNRPDRAPAAR